MDFRSFHQRLLIAVLALAGLVSCSRDERPLEERLQEALDERLQQCHVKGASVAVILPDESLWRGMSGVSHETVKMHPDMSFAIGSITKNMVAALVLQLVEEGKLSLEDPIGRWLPPYPNVDSSITIRQLLNHTSGLFMFWENQQIWDDLIQYRTKTFSPEEVLGYLKEPHFPPGEGYRYSNTNYLLAAVIVTQVTGSGLSTELRKRFWEPLGLRSACLAIEEPYPENMAHVWGDNFEKDGLYRDITFLPRTSHDSITYGSAGVFMTAEDLARWTHALFHGRAIRKGSLAQMQDLTGEGTYGLGIGRLGWKIVGRVPAVGHGGGNIGTTAYMVYLPDHDVSIAVMINHFGGGCATRIVRDLARISAQSVRPESVFAILWSVEGLLSGLWILAGLGAAFFAIRKNNPMILIVFGGVAISGGLFSTRTFMLLNHVLVPEGSVALMLGMALFLLRLVRRRTGGR
jgi:D-alanyl-D-alanine carboxypeptidase